MRSGRVIIVSDYVGGEGAASGGAGHAALDSYRALRSAGADVRIVAGFGKAPADTDGRFRSLGGRDLRAGGALDTLRAVYNRSAYDALAADLACEDPSTTVVILHQWTRYLSPAALGLLDRFSTMIYMHDYFWACPNGAYYDFQKQQPCDRRPMGERCLTTDCDRQGRLQKAGRVARQAVRGRSVRAGPERRLFLHLSDSARLNAAPLLPREWHTVIHNPLDLPAAGPLPPGPFQFDIGYFGRLEPEKGVQQLAEAVGRLGLTGLFVGEGTLEEYLARRPGLVHRRWAPRSDMVDAMRACSVVVLPSLWRETWGLIVPEAIAAGVKVLVSTRAGSAEVVERFGGGAVFDPGTAGDLDRQLVTLLANPVAPVIDWTGLRRTLSPEEHGRRLIHLAAERFGIDLLTHSGEISWPAA